MNLVERLMVCAIISILAGLVGTVVVKTYRFAKNQVYLWSSVHNNKVGEELLYMAYADKASWEKIDYRRDLR